MSAYAFSYAMAQTPKAETSKSLTSSETESSSPKEDANAAVKSQKETEFERILRGADTRSTQPQNEFSRILREDAFDRALRGAVSPSRNAMTLFDFAGIVLSATFGIILISLIVSKKLSRGRAIRIWLFGFFFWGIGTLLSVWLFDLYRDMDDGELFHMLGVIFVPPLFFGAFWLGYKKLVA